MNYSDVINELNNLADDKYKAFSSKITNTHLPFYGVRTPDLRNLGKRIAKEYPDFAEDFFARETYSFEEVLLCGWTLGKDYAANIALLKRLIPRMECWAHVDQIIAKYKWVKDPETFLCEFEYLKSGGEFEMRAYVMMMFNLCVNSGNLHIISRELPAVPQGRYYVDMAIAWLLCEIVIKFYDEGVKLLNADYITQWVRRKAISKCRDSFRLTQEQKDYLATLR